MTPLISYTVNHSKERYNKVINPFGLKFRLHPVGATNGEIYFGKL